MDLQLKKSQYCSCNDFSSANLNILFILKYDPKLGYAPYHLTNKGLWMENLSCLRKISCLLFFALMESTQAPLRVGCLIEAVTGFGIALKINGKGMHCRSKKPESLHEVSRSDSHLNI
jgi:hypothetical protein